ncbi:MAG: hypothetical protein HKP30_17360 [Myxococcales bacterium]|nr:hypothetical protein [Myxococcales bacterium]
MTSRRILSCLVALGVLLRVALLASAENRLEADESLVALMGLDILAGRSLPFFVYRTTYDGGGAFEAYLSAAGFALLGDAPWVPKAMVLVVWTAAALLFAGLVRRHLEPQRARLATLFFCVGTPFFLEWSLKARGGYEETLLLSLLLLWLPGWPRLSGRPLATGASFGAIAGIALWISEMILPLLPGALVWLGSRRPAAERPRLLAGLVVGALLGVLPLLLYNLGHDWAHLRTSVVARMLVEDGRPLGWRALRDSAAFVLGPGHLLALSAIAFAGFRLARRRRPLGLEHVLLLNLLLYAIGYWLGGLRYLAIPPSRVLFQVYPSVAVLLAVALDVPRRAPRALRIAAVTAAAVWIASVAVPTARWMASGEPRETGSWRGSWSLVDGAALHRELVDRNVKMAFTSYWTLWPLRFETERAQRGLPPARKLLVSDAIPTEPLPPGRIVAFVLQPGTEAFRRVELTLRSRGIAHEREAWGDYVIFSGIESSAVHTGLGFPAGLVRNALPLPPRVSDGFN